MDSCTATRTIHLSLSTNSLKGIGRTLNICYNQVIAVEVNEFKIFDAGFRQNIANLRLGAEQGAGAWRLKQFVRVNNLFDRNYIGSVIVGDGNGRFYEPAPGRNWMLGASAQYVF